MKLTKNQWYIVGVVALIAIWYFFIRKKPTTTAILEENKYASGKGSQMVEPIITFVIAMKKYANNIEMKNDAIKNFWFSFKEIFGTGVSPVRLITVFVYQKFNTLPNTTAPYDPRNPVNEMSEDLKFMINMKSIKYMIFVEPIKSFVNDIKRGENDKMAIKNFRNKMAKI
jgi:hypothetical protein